MPNIRLQLLDHITYHTHIGQSRLISLWCHKKWHPHKETGKQYTQKVKTTTLLQSGIIVGITLQQMLNNWGSKLPQRVLSVVMHTFVKYTLRDIGKNEGYRYLGHLNPVISTSTLAKKLFHILNQSEKESVKKWSAIKF